MIIVTTPSCSGKRRAFTLIELLVVISIISLLSSVVLSSLSTARSKARDARRLSDIRQIQNAMEARYAELGNYDTETSPNAVSNVNTSPTGSWNILEAKLSNYSSGLPKDPLNSGEYLYSFVRSTSASYTCNSLPWSSYEYIIFFRTETNFYGSSKLATNIGSNNQFSRCLPGPLKS